MNRVLFFTGSLLLLLLLSLTSVVQAEKTITLMSHDSFNVSQEVIATFEAEHGVKVRFLKAGDAGAALVQAILALVYHCTASIGGHRQFYQPMVGS